MLATFNIIIFFNIPYFYVGLYNCFIIYQILIYTGISDLIHIYVSEKPLNLQKATLNVTGIMKKMGLEVSH